VLIGFIKPQTKLLCELKSYMRAGGRSQRTPLRDLNGRGKAPAAKVRRTNRRLNNNHLCVCELGFGERYTASRLRSGVRPTDLSLPPSGRTTPHPAGSIAPLRSRDLGSFSLLSSRVHGVSSIVVGFFTVRLGSRGTAGTGVERVWLQISLHRACPSGTVR
jgi:hypothetical protein